MLKTPEKARKEPNDQSFHISVKKKLIIDASPHAPYRE